MAGVIAREKVPAFERILWRACRGNVFLRYAEIETPLEDPYTVRKRAIFEVGILLLHLINDGVFLQGDRIYKSVFIIFFQGDQLKNRVKKICEGLVIGLVYIVASTSYCEVPGSSLTHLRIYGKEAFLVL